MPDGPLRRRRRGPPGPPGARWRPGCGPTTLDDVVGQEHLLGPGRPLRTLIEADRLSSVILWGPPGTGKTTIAQLIAHTTAKAFVQLSAVDGHGEGRARGRGPGAEDRLGQRDQGTILFLDEVHRFNKAQQDALLPSVESGLLVLIGATTENPYFEVNPPLLSRSTLFRLEPLERRRRGHARSSGASRPRAPTIDDRGPRPSWSSGPTATVATRSPASRWRWPWPTSARRERTAGAIVDDARPTTSRPRSAPRPSATAATTTTTSSAPSSRASGAPTPTPASTGWPACSRPARTPASSPGAW